VHRRRRALGSALVARAAGVGAAIAAVVAGCTDLFHSTDDLRSACEIDAATPGCSPDAGAANDASLCAPSSDAGKAQAARVCAMLGACEGPLGGNAFGPCVVEARLAFDCAANPNHPVGGSLRDRWACLAAAASCADVDACLLAHPSPCRDAGASIACEGDDLRVECPGPDAGAFAAPFVEDCALWGLACDRVADAAVCGPVGPPIDCFQFQGICGPSLLTVQVCVDGGPSVGRDCSGNGAQRCAGFPANVSPPQWVACVPSTATDAGCNAGLAIACSGGVAHSCPTGAPESIDCASLLDAPDACAGGTVASGFDWTSGCTLGTTCPPDSCDGGWLSSCSRGAAFGVDCAVVKPGGACHLVAAGGGTVARAACSPP
jgi:hypothetical protein